MPTSTVEDYLKSMFHLAERAGTKVTVGAVAEDLGVTPGTVSSMMRHLSEEGLVEYEPRRSVRLLPRGREQAVRVIRRHRLIETFLVTVMKLDWSEVHAEAEILEHVVSDRLLQRMDEMLGHPSHDPHGHPIPDSQGNIEDQELHRLVDVKPGAYRIVRVGDSDSQFLDWLRDHDLFPGCEVRVLMFDSVAGVLEVAVQPTGREIRLGEKAANSILVEPAR